jgi:hypothetical protein
LIFVAARVLLPVEVRARCDGRDLRCLTVSQALELLYGGAQRDKPAEVNASSFARVSSRDDYLIPTSYSRLQRQQEEAMKKVMVPPMPALASVPGSTYPGPAVLGDARALTAFLMQQQSYELGEPERTGWIIFAGDALCDGGRLELAIDLGDGETELSFMIPGP